MNGDLSDGHTTYADDSHEPPIALPRVTVRVLDPTDSRTAAATSIGEVTGGRCTVTLDTPDSPRHANRASQQPAALTVPTTELGAVLAKLTEEEGTAVRVEIHETDGTIRSDVLTPPDLCGGDPPNQPTGDHTAAGVAATGFQPGEPVMIACVVHTAPADSNGHLPLPLGPTPTTIPRDAQWILVGRTSKTVASRRDGLA